MADRPSRVFISYARADIRHLTEFCTYTADLRHNGVQFLDDRTIPPGQDFERTLSGYLDQADVVVLLLTQNYVNSDYCMTVELPRVIRNLEMGRCRILPLNVEEFYTTPESALSGMQWTPSGEPITQRSMKARKKAWIDAAWILYQYIEARDTVTQETAGTSNPMPKPDSGSMCIAGGLRDQDANAATPQISGQTGQTRRLWHLSSAERKGIAAASGLVLFACAIAQYTQPYSASRIKSFLASLGVCVTGGLLIILCVRRITNRTRKSAAWLLPTLAVLICAGVIGGASGYVLPRPSLVASPPVPPLTHQPPASVPVARAQANAPGQQATSGLPTAPTASTPGRVTTRPETPAPRSTRTPVPTSPPTSPGTRTEEAYNKNGVRTFRNYDNASGSGRTLTFRKRVQVSCKVYDPSIASAKPGGYWYRIASPPWNNTYYACANTFLNGDPPGGPWTHQYDHSVTNCLSMACLGRFTAQLILCRFATIDAKFHVTG
jgi:TIR domain-containing protein